MTKHGQLTALKRSVRTHARMVQQERDALQAAYLCSIQALLTALEARDAYTRGHSERVRSWAIRIARHLGVSQPQVEIIGQAARLHDIGKVGVRDAILFKPSSLTPQEWQIMRSHPEVGVSILKPVRLLQSVLPITRGHHERWDGKGYPDGLQGEAIPLGARIVAVADAYDALKSCRPYRQGFTPEEARGILCEGAGRQWDEHVVAALLEVQAGLKVVPSSIIEEKAVPVVDPVCGMEVIPDYAQARVRFGDSAIYFCSPECREVFDESPEEYV